MITQSIGSGTVAGLLEFLDTIVEKGRATQSAIQPIKISINKVFEVVDGSEWELVSVKSIDLDDHIERFATKTIGTYSPKSISVYKSRINRAIAWYMKFLNEKGWMPQVKPRLPASSKRANIETPPVQPDTTGSMQPVVAVEPSNYLINNALTYPFPLENGEIARLSLPRELTASDANRLAKFIQTLVMETDRDQ